MPKPTPPVRPEPPGGWFYDKPVPWLLSAGGEAALDGSLTDDGGQS